MDGDGSPTQQNKQKQPLPGAGIDPQGLGTRFPGHPEQFPDRPGKLKLSQRDKSLGPDEKLQTEPKVRYAIQKHGVGNVAVLMQQRLNQNSEQRQPGFRREPEIVNVWCGLDADTAGPI